jgi:DNA primase catalytic core
MPRIKDESVERVKAAIEILPLVEEVVRLRKTGAAYTGLCPFHQERTPSFNVSPARGTFKCFGCGEGGDAIAFVMKMENIEFVEAIELLGQRFGVELEYEESSPEQERKRAQEKRLTDLLERATKLYTHILWETEQGEPARQYLASRNLGEPVCREFRLGYAPAGSTLATRAVQEGFSREELLAVGLSNRGGYDYFQRRIVFPLADRRGEVLGFQARKLFDDDPLQGKYVNSPETGRFHKGNLLYGLDLTRQIIAKDDRAVIVEGNTDVIALRQAGFGPVVASMGTALTEAQLKDLSRLTRRLFLCLDADTAGAEATLRGIDLAIRYDFRVRVVVLEPGTDPADNPAAFKDALEESVSYPVHRVRLEHARATDPQAAFASIRAFLTSLPDSPEQHDAVRLAADLLDLPPETQAGLAPARGSARTAGIVSPRLLDAGQRLERSALAGVAAHEALRSELEALPPELFDDELHQRARAYLLGQEGADGELTSLLAELYAIAERDSITEETGRQLLMRLRERDLKKRLFAADGARLVELQKELATLRDEIRAFA